MGIWSYLFPGDEGILADLFWSNQQTSQGITLKNKIYRGTSGDDTVSIAQLRRPWKTQAICGTMAL
jgi:hypothetical protein